MSEERVFRRWNEYFKKLMNEENQKDEEGWRTVSDLESAEDQ